MGKYAKLFLRLSLTFALVCAGFYVLEKYDYITQFSQIDNVLGLLPVIFVILAVGGLIVLLWIKHRERLPVTITLAIFVLLCAALFPTALRGNWWLNAHAPDGTESAPDLTLYAPFKEDTLAAKLDEKSTLVLAENLPVLDGATALYPLYAAFAQAVYDQDAFSDDKVICTNTRAAYQGIIEGKRDIIFVAQPAQSQLDTAKEAGADLVFTPIGKEAFVFLAGKSNPIESLTLQQIQNIYTGKTSYWHTLTKDIPPLDSGNIWEDFPHIYPPIIKLQRPEGSGSQTGLQDLMGDLPIQVPQPLPDPIFASTSSLLQQVSVTWRGVQPVLGYSYRYFAVSMFRNPDTKLLKIEGIEPSPENIGSGAYPLTGDFFAVTNGEPQGNAKLLIDWILTQQGQELVLKTGYSHVE